MAKLSRRSIPRRTVEALTVEKDTVFWDRDLPGFGVRVYALGTKIYVVQSRAGGNSVRVTVGRHGVITADEARRRAARIVNRIKAGEDPVAEPLPARLAGGPTVADLAARYMEEHVAVRCKASTLEGSVNSLAALPADVFDDLTSLEQLHLDENNLNSLPADVLDGLTSLEQLSLDENNLNSLPDGVFEDLTALTSLWLHNNPGSAGFKPTADAGGDRAARIDAGVTLDGSPART